MDSNGALECPTCPSRCWSSRRYIGLEWAPFMRPRSKVSLVEMNRRTAARRRSRPGQGRCKNASKSFPGDLLERQSRFARRTGRTQSSHVRGRRAEKTSDSAACYCASDVAEYRRPGLEKAGVQLDPAGSFRSSPAPTATPVFSPCGDVAGEPMLAHKASHEGKTAVEVILGKPVAYRAKAIPAVVFTDPEIAWPGCPKPKQNVRDAPSRSRQFSWVASGRVPSHPAHRRVTKWVIDPQSKLVVGCGIVGYGRRRSD